MAEAHCSIPDHQYVDTSLSGETASISDLIYRLRDNIYRLCYSILRHHQDAEDMTQESLIRAMKSSHCWDRSRPLQPWVMTIAANRCRTALAKRKKQGFQSSQHEQADYPVADTTENAVAVQSMELVEELDRGLAKLKPELRQCFELFYQQQMSCAEVAEAMGCPEGTVKTWLHRARHHLSSELIRRGIAPSMRINEQEQV